MDSAGDARMLPYGVVGRPHGLAGALLVHPFNAHARPSVQPPLPVTLVRGGGERLTIELADVRPTADALVVRFAGIDSREAAAALTNAELWVPRASLPPLGAGEYYVEDLLGCAVFDQAGRARGEVRGTFWNGAQDVLTVTGPDGEELLVPAVPEFIREVDLAARRLVVDPHVQEEDDGA